MAERRYVVDTNVLIGTVLFEGSIPWQALTWARETGHLVVSAATFAEFIAVLHRRKFDRYLSPTRRNEILSGLRPSILTIEPTSNVEDCRDPGDNKFLALALDGRADCIISGDPHLLELHPWRGIPILNPKDFVESLER